MQIRLQTISAILKNIIGKVCRDNNIRKPKIVIAVPQNISELEERTVAEVGRDDGQQGKPQGQKIL